MYANSEMKDIMIKIIVAIVLLIIFISGLWLSINSSGLDFSNKKQSYIVISKENPLIKYEGKKLGFDYYVIYSNHYPNDISGKIIIPKKVKVDDTWNISYYEKNIDNSYWYNMLKISDLHNKSTGIDIRIGIIDTGVDITHSYLKGHIYGGRSYIEDEPYYKDDVGHGTFVAGIIRTIAPDSQIYVYKVFGNSQYTTEDKIMEALNDAINDGMNIISVSIGAETNSYTYDELSQYFDKMAELNKSLIVVSAGNTYSYNDISSPARAYNVISVGAIDNLNKVADFSSKGWGINYSYKPNLVSFGVNIKSTAVPPLDGSINDLDGKVNGMAIDSGTSFSCPMISGLSALIMSYWHITNISYLKKFVETHTKYIKGYNPIQVGNGKPNPDTILKFNYTIDEPKSLGNLISYNKAYYNFTINTYNMIYHKINLIHTNIDNLTFGYLGDKIYFNISLKNLKPEIYYAYFNVSNLVYSFVFTKEVSIKIVYNRMPFVVSIVKYNNIPNYQFYWGGKISLNYFEEYKVSSFGFYKVIVLFTNPDVLIEKKINISSENRLFYINDTANSFINTTIDGYLMFYNKTIFLNSNKLYYNGTIGDESLNLLYFNKSFCEKKFNFGKGFINENLTKKIIFINNTNITLKYGYGGYEKIIKISRGSVLNISYSNLDLMINNYSISNFGNISYFNGTIFNNVLLNNTTLTIINQINNGNNTTYNNKTIDISGFSKRYDNITNISMFFGKVKILNINDKYRMFISNYISSIYDYSYSYEIKRNINFNIHKYGSYIDFNVNKINISGEIKFNLNITFNNTIVKVNDFYYRHIASQYKPYIEIYVNNGNNSNKLVKGVNYLFSISQMFADDVVKYEWIIQDSNEIYYGTTISYTFNNVGKYLIEVYGFDYKGNIITYTERYFDVYQKFINYQKVVVEHGNTMINITIKFSKPLPYLNYIVSYAKVQRKMYVGYKYIIKIDFSKIPKNVSVLILITIDGNIIYPDNSIFSNNYITNGKEIISDWTLHNSFVKINVHKHKVLYFKLNMDFYDRLYDGIRTIYYQYRGD